MLDDDNKWFDRKSKNVLVVGTARNCARYIKEDILEFQSALQDFNQVHWLVIESDSKDNTLAKLNELAENIARFRFISLGMLSKEYPLRTARIAFCRNTYLKELRENQIYREINFVVVMDLDGINQLVTVQAISSCFIRDDWDVCTANQQDYYHDIWALRHNLWCPNDCWQQFQFHIQFGLSHKKAVRTAVKAKQIVIPKDTDWIEVDSAFGGMAIYHRRVLENGKYIGIREDGTKICEHVTLHRQIKEQGFKIFINPALINGTRTNHGKRFINYVLKQVLNLLGHVKRLTKHSSRRLRRR